MRFSSDFAFHAYSCNFWWGSLTILNLSLLKMRMRPIFHLRSTYPSLKSTHVFWYIFVRWLIHFILCKVSLKQLLVDEETESS